MASRFAKSKEGDKTHYSDAATNPSAKITWLNTWNLWAKERGYVKNIHEYNPQELDKISNSFISRYERKTAINMNHNVSM